MKILVTGANGYIGEGVVKRLLDDGVDVVATDKSGQHIDARATCKICNLFDIEDPYRWFGEPDVVLHLAWRNGFVHDDLSHIDDLPYHVRFIRALSTSGVGRVAVMGTMHEVGFYEGSIKESTPTNPTSLYGIAKDALRKAAMSICDSEGISLQWIRGFYIVGNASRGSSVFSKLADAERRGDEAFPFTSGENQWDFLDYDEFCAQVAAIVEQSEVLGIINACSGRPEKLACAVESFIAKNGYRIKLDYGAFPDRPYDSKAIWGDNSAIERIMSRRCENAMSQVGSAGNSAQPETAFPLLEKKVKC